MDILKQENINSEGSLDTEIKSQIKDLVRQFKSTEDVCEECGITLKNKTILQKHIKVVHADSPPEECEECGITLKNKNTLQNHIKVVHIAIRPFSCPECNSTFKSHSAIHSDNKPFACNICDKTFKLSQSKRSHMMTHVKDRKPTHFCPECGKGFLKAQALKSHIPLHSGEKNHTCEICSTKFSQEVNMKKHLTAMHGNGFL